MREVFLSLMLVPLSAIPLAAQASPSSSQRLALEEERSLPEEFTLEKALAIFRTRSPLLLAERQRELAARADLEQAGKLPNPVFALDTEQLGVVNGSTANRELFLSVAQEIELGGKRKKRSLVAESLVLAAKSDVRAFERLMTFQLKVAHAALVLAQSNVELANETLSDFDQVVSLSRIRYERGEISGGELRRVEAERLGFLESQVAAEIDLEDARAELLGLLGLPEYSKPFQAVPPPRLEKEPADVGPLTAEALIARAEVTAQAERREAARRQVDLERSLAVPNIVPFVTYQRTRESGAGHSAFINFGIGVGIPVFNRNQGGVGRARAELRREEEFERALEYQVAVEVRKARQAFLSERKRVQFFEETYLQISEQARDISEAAYRMGGDTLINFLDASRVYRGTLQAYYRALYDLRVARYGLELAVGSELT
jgi:cobalt-zinc-cadmium efflux system outer membrane protein